MNRDAVIQKRLDELFAKGKAIQDAYTTQSAGSRGNRVSKHISYADGVGWITSVASLLHQVFGPESVHFSHFNSIIPNLTTYLESFNVFFAIFSAAKEDYEGGYIFNLKGLIKAEVLTDALEQAETLLSAGYKDPACVLVGVSLEIAVKDLAARKAVPIAKLDKMNADLCKANLYNIAKQKQITAWADLRNKSAHGDWAAYKAEDVQEMLTGVRRFIADYL